MIAPRGYARLRWIAIGAILLPAMAFFALWYQHTYLAQQREIRRIEAHKLSLDAINTQSRSLVGSLSRDTLATVLRQFDKQAAYVARLVPPDTLKSTLLPQITSTAEQHGVQIKKMTPVAAGTQLGFTTSGYDVTLVGGYHQIAGTMAALLALDHITQIRNVKLRTVAKGLVEQESAAPARRTLGSRATGPASLDKKAMLVARESEATFTIRSFAVPANSPSDSASADSTAKRPVKVKKS